MSPSKRGQKPKQQQEPVDEGGDLSRGEATANGIATITCSGVIGYFLGWPVDFVGYLAYGTFPLSL